MKKLAAVLFVALAVGSLAAARELSAIRKDGTILIGTEGAFAPFNYFEGKTLTGFEIDLANAIVAKENLKPKWITLPFDSLLAALNQDRFDFVIASHGITAERQKAVDFSNPHYCTGGIIVYKGSGPKTMADLTGKVVAVQVGTSYLDHVQQIKGIKEIKTFPKDTDALQNLIAGRVDAWVSDRFVAMDAIKANKDAGLKTGDLLFQEKIAMAVKKGNKSVLDALNAGLAAVVKDGTYKKISDKWFGTDIGCK